MSHVVIACDKFKGSLTAADAVAALAIGIRAVRPDMNIDRCPVADGGDGTVRAAIEAGYRSARAVVEGPTGAAIEVEMALRDSTAVIEVAAVCGLAVLPGGMRAPLIASSYGVGQLISAALDRGCAHIVLGLGGSACTDGGSGMLQALGARVLTTNSRPVARGGGPLTDVASADFSALDPRLASVDIMLASDVSNPLVGPRGAAAIFGPQKGATEREVRLLDGALAAWADCVSIVVGVDLRNAQGAGAAGGIGFAALAGLAATTRSGIDFVLELTNLRSRLNGAALVITGEGSLDSQTMFGKAVVGVARAAADAGVPAVAAAGRSSLTAAQLHGIGIRRSYALTRIEPDPEKCMLLASHLLALTGQQIARDWLAP